MELRPLLLLLVVALLGAPAAAQAAPAPRVTVMTRNLFLGADLIPLATTPPGAPFQQAAGTLFDGVKATDPDARMKLIAREIADGRPGSRRPPGGLALAHRAGARRRPSPSTTRPR